MKSVTKTTAVGLENEQRAMPQRTQTMVIKRSISVFFMKLAMLMYLLSELVICVHDSKSTSQNGILQIMWRHNLNNLPFRSYFDKSEWEIRSEKLKLIYSDIDISSIEYHEPWIYENPVHGDIFLQRFEINKKSFHVIPLNPQHNHLYSDFFDLLAKLRMKYELRELRDNSFPVGLLCIATEEMNFAFFYKEGNDYFIAFYEDAKLIIGRNQFITIKYDKKAITKISKSFYRQLTYWATIWDSKRIPYSRGWIHYSAA